MSLSRRLTLLILLCIMPMMLAAIVTLAGLYEQRSGELADMADEQVNIVDADLAGLMEGARSLLLALAQSAADSGCPQRLDALRRTLPAYRTLGVIERQVPGGAIRGICTSGPGLTDGLADRPAWLADLPADPGFHIGAYMATAPPGAQGVLPLVWRSVGADGRERIALAMMDLAWLGQHLAALRIGNASRKGDVLTVHDRNGALLARVPASDPAAPPAAHPDDEEHLVAVSPAGVVPGGLTVTASLDPNSLLASLQDTIVRASVLGIIAVSVALLIATMAARHAIQLPAARLLTAARRWADGELSARVDIRSDHSEFGFLAGAFNRMAADIEARVAAHAQEAKELETRVAGRTRELSERNNRLQVEIAERRRAETGLHQAQKLQAVGQLAGGIAHDFNNLLATILGSLELIERRAGSADERFRALVTRAIEAVQRGSQLTSRLLAFSRRQRLAARPTDINRLITDLVALATSTLGRGVRVETRLVPTLWPAMVDAGQLEAAILNLALNARDAMPQGGVVTLATSNRTIEDGDADTEAGDYVCITVADTGAGMAGETLARAFEPFFTTKELGAGSGLGLSQVYGLAQQSGGTVGIQSALGAGTTVTLLLPRAHEAVPVKAEPPPPPPRASSELVLLVDDDPDVRHVSVQMLHDLGYAVAEAKDGEHALAVVRDLPAPPVLLVLDYAMPGMNGLRLAALLRSSGIKAPLVLATGYAELTDDRSGVKPDAILHKPFSLSELERILATLRARMPETAA